MLSTSTVVTLRHAQVLAKRVVADQIPAGSVEAAWLSGSLVEGLAHGSSDIDLFVATKRLGDELPVTRRHAGYAVHAFIAEGYRYDVEYWELGAIEALAGKLRSIRSLGAEANLSLFLSLTETAFAHRMLTAVPLTNSEVVEGLRASIDRPMLLRYLYQAALHRYDDAFDDSVGMLRAGQLEGAALRARAAVGWAVDLLIHALGSTNPQEKFRVEKLRQLSQTFPDLDHVIGRYWSVESGVPRDRSNIDRYVHETLECAEALSAAVQDAVAEAKHDGGSNGDSRLLTALPEVLRGPAPTPG